MLPYMEMTSYMTKEKWHKLAWLRLQFACKKDSLALLTHIALK